MIPLDIYWGRQAAIELYPDRLRLRLPFYLGARRIEIGLHQVVAVPVYPTAERPRFPDWAAYPQIAEDGLLIPYLATRICSFPQGGIDPGPPTLMLAFARPVRLPRLRLHTGDSPTILPPPLGSIASRARDGVTIDGAFLRAVPQAEALRRLSAGGVSVGGDWRTWQRSHPRDDTAIQRNRVAAEEHYYDVTGNLILVWVLLLVLGAVAIIIGVNLN
ncbi:hypothetical protein I6A60_34905 [Frankia sp. AgB1.9]|uniref:hypothetical protein n=1 Tax=unclassified Frankia TaxID=2632575 RepID=UPI001932EE08|nr:MULTISPECIES: hypothetical protein [unclassified Frankia]MBL7493685.1 hypothetical protein [Frankia sp. AgW1.1]MBL7553004.1 hypothetical protein [Frankia sp. AgB1.9]MBL7624588.1 hypothetical protein [Frankia sp. AgB1.8]